MISKKYVKGSIIIILVLLIAGITMLTPTFAESGKKSVTVYLTVSKDNEFVTGVDGTVMAHVPFTVSYFDLADLGLQQYRRLKAEPFEMGGHYISGSDVIEEPTLLHCFIEALGQYYVGRPLTSSDMHSDAINVSGPAEQLYMTQFWGHNYNLMYFVNHAYPLMAPGIGATCDYILLNENDEIEVAMFSDETVRMSGAFCAFDKSEADVYCGDTLTLTLSGVPMYESSEGQTVSPVVMPGETIRISSDHGNTWEDAGVTTDSSGSFTLTFDTQGTYYVSAGPNFKTYQFVAPPICIVNVTEKTAPDPGPGPDPVDQLTVAKTQAKSDLAAYKESKDLSLYRDEQKEELAAAVEKGNAAIDAASDVDGVTSALYAAKAEIDKVKTDAQMKEEEAARKLNEAKDNAKNELDLYMAPSEYREAERALLMEILTEGRTAIDAAETEDAVKVLLTEYKGRIDQLKTDEQYETEEKAARQEETERKAREKAAAIKKAKAAKTTVSVKALTKHKAKVTWKKVTLSYTVDGKKYTRAVTGYKVYRVAKKNGKYKVIKTIKKAGTLKYTDRKLKKGRKYYYKVRTYTKIDGRTYLGKWSKVKKITAK